MPDASGTAPPIREQIETILARVEHFLAEVLSRIEDRRPAPGGWASTPLQQLDLHVPSRACGLR